MLFMMPFSLSLSSLLLTHLSSYDNFSQVLRPNNFRGDLGRFAARASTAVWCKAVEVRLAVSPTRSAVKAPGVKINPKRMIRLIR